MQSGKSTVDGIKHASTTQSFAICFYAETLTCMLIQVRYSFSFIRDVKMGYRRLKEKVKEYKRRDGKLYGNMISKLNKLEDTEDNVSSLLNPRPNLPCDTLMAIGLTVNLLLLLLQGANESGTKQEAWALMATDRNA
jgi:hypothetical protein